MLIRVQREETGNALHGIANGRFTEAITKDMLRSVTRRLASGEQEPDDKVNNLVPGKSESNMLKKEENGRSYLGLRE